MTIALKTASWPIVFQFGAVCTLAMIPVVMFFAPESIAFEIQTQRRGALDRVNRTLARMKRPALDALPLAYADPPSCAGGAAALQNAAALRGAVAPWRSATLMASTLDMLASSSV